MYTMRAKSLMPDDADTDLGRPKTTDDEVFLDAVDALDPAGTSRIRDRVESKTGWSLDESTAYRRLEKLSDRGELAKQIDGNKALWMTMETFGVVVSDEIFTDALRALEGINTTKEIANEVGFDETSTLIRLQKLQQEGVVSSRNQDSEGDTLWTLAN